MNRPPHRQGAGGVTAWPTQTCKIHKDSCWWESMAVPALLERFMQYKGTPGSGTQTETCAIALLPSHTPQSFWCSISDRSQELAMDGGTTVLLPMHHNKSPQKCSHCTQHSHNHGTSHSTSPSPREDWWAEYWCFWKRAGSLSRNCWDSSCCRRRWNRRRGPQRAPHETWLHESFDLLRTMRQCPEVRMSICTSTHPNKQEKHVQKIVDIHFPCARVGYL